MKKFIPLIRLNLILFGTDIAIAFLIPLLTTIAVTETHNTSELTLIDFSIFVGILVSITTLVFTNNKSNLNEKDSFVPFTNTLFTLAPLALLPILEHKEAAPTFLTLPYIAGSILNFIYHTLLKKVTMKIELKRIMIQEILSAVLEIIQIWKDNPRISLASDAGKHIEFHFRHVIALIEVESEISLTELFKLDNIEEIKKEIDRRGLARILEESTDSDPIKLSGRTIIGTGYFQRKLIIEYLFTLYEASIAKTNRAERFRRARRNCPFYEGGEQPASTARDWLKKTKYFIAPMWEERQKNKHYAGN